MYLKIGLLWLASNVLQAFYVVIIRHGGGAAAVGFITQVLFFYMKAWRANTFGDEEQRHDWLERHNAQRQSWEWVAPASVLLVWNMARQARLRVSKDQGFQPLRGRWAQHERLSEILQWAQGCWARRMSPHMAWMVTSVYEVTASATIPYRALEPAAQQARRSPEDSQVTLIGGEGKKGDPCNKPATGRFFLDAGVQTETEVPVVTRLEDWTGDSAAAELATHIGEIQSLKWPDHVRSGRVSILARFRSLTSREKRRKEELTDKNTVRELTLRETEDLNDLELLDFEVDYTTLRIPPDTQFHGFDGILSPSATNENVWQLLVPAFWTFSRGRPTCVFFDGYSGTGKSYTMFKGPNAIAVRFTRALDNFLRTRGVDRKFDVTTATVRHDTVKVKGEVDDGPSAKRASLQEVQGKIEEAWRERDGSNRKTENNPESSRSHLVIELSVDVKIDGKQLSLRLGLVDLAGNEKGIPGHDLEGTKTAGTPAGKSKKQVAEAEQQEAERGFIVRSRSALLTSLLDCHNINSINESKVELHRCGLIQQLANLVVVN